MIKWITTTKFHKNEMMDILDLKNNLLNPNALKKDGREIYENIMEMLDNGIDGDINLFYIKNRVANLYD